MPAGDAAAADEVLIDALGHVLAGAADAAKAPQMQRYMKSDMPYLGVRVPEVRRLTRQLERSGPPADRARLAATVRGLWDRASHREERYAAIELLGTATARQLLRDRPDPALVTLVERLVRDGAWWDYVDNLAHVVEFLLDSHPTEMQAVLRRWSTDDDHWLRRISIISQLGRKDRTDTTLLTEVVDANLGDPEFFVRKAIGWALRTYARTDPDWVRRFVEAQGDRMSGLSRREAMKHLGPSPGAGAG